MSDHLKNIPSVDSILKNKEIKHILNHIDREIVANEIRRQLQCYRLNPHPFEKNEIISLVIESIKTLTDSSLKPVLNATGVILHTNLGRSPINPMVFEKIKKIACGYCNLEIDLNTGERGERNSHLRRLFKLLTGAEDVLIVNNNAAAVWMILQHFAKDKEVIISRAELVEIGGSFRIPDIMSASGAVLKEIGTTNCTYLHDYEKAINEKTALLFKAHQSNYFISGHTAMPESTEIAALAGKYNIPFVYDIGSGLLCNIEGVEEPSIQRAISDGADLVTFSCDKLLGANQAGIIAGKKELIRQLAKNPMMRVLRVDKITLALLEESLKLYLSKNDLLQNNEIMRMLHQDTEELQKKASLLSDLFFENEIKNMIVSSKGCSGGGTLPNWQKDSFMVMLDLPDTINHEKLRLDLMQVQFPIISILKERKICFDVLTLDETHLSHIVRQVKECLSNHLLQPAKAKKG